MATISFSRRPIRDGAERSNELSCRMSPIPSAPAGTNVQQTAPWRETGRAWAVCRGHGENSNAGIAPLQIRGGFIAMIGAGAIKIFSAKISLAWANPPILAGQPGANPNARSKRFA
jgi:hypothetical protein